MCSLLGLNSARAFRRCSGAHSGQRTVSAGSNKAAQGNPSDGHAQQHNWQVVSFALQLLGANPLEFEVTKHNHVKSGALNGKQPTVTVCFREPPHGAVREAWRILWGAVGHLALFPAKVRWAQASYSEGSAGRLA